MAEICYIIGAGEHYENDSPAPLSGDLVIAADGGYNYVSQKGIKADIILGDFDSVSGEIRSDDSEVIRLNPIKDETDTLYAVLKGIEMGYRIFHIYGGTGGRTDHTIANIQCLAMLARKGLQGFLFGEKEIMTSIYNSSVSFDENASGYISVFSLDTESRGVTETGLKYEITDYTLKNTCPVGVSNEFTGKKSSVSVKDGTLLLIYPKNT